MSKGRDRSGKFAAGNSGGPGRPKRVVEVDYLIAASEVISLDRWKRIIERAATDAENGDPKAREWLAGYLMPQGGSNTPPLQHKLEQEEREDRIERGEQTLGDLVVSWG